MTKPDSVPYLSKREQQIMDVLYANDLASANEVMAALSDSPGNATVRKLLRILEEKDQIEHIEDKGVFRYRPKVNKDSAAKGALNKLVQTFFAGSLRDTVATLIDARDRSLTDKEAEELRALIEAARNRDVNS